MKTKISFTDYIINGFKSFNPEIDLSNFVNNNKVDIMSLVKVCGIKIKFQKYYEPLFNCIFLDKKYSIIHQRWQAAYDLGKFVYNYNHEINPYWNTLKVRLLL